MKFNIEYKRPGQPRISSGWIKTVDSYIDTILFAYRDHGFEIKKIDDRRYVMKHPKQGERTLMLRPNK